MERGKRVGDGKGGTGEGGRIGEKERTEDSEQRAEKTRITFSEKNRPG